LASSHFNDIGPMLVVNNGPI